MALIFSTFLWSPEPLLQYPCVRAQPIQFESRNYVEILLASQEGPDQGTPPPYMREIGTMWQIGVLTGKPCTFLVQNRSFSAFWHYKNKEGLSRGLDVKWHIPSSCLDALRKWFSTGICSINRASEWLRLETQETPPNGQNVHRFQARTPICHIVPVSRAYTPPPPPPPQSAPETALRSSPRNQGALRSAPESLEDVLLLVHHGSEIPSVLLGIPWPALRSPLRNHF